MNADRAGATRGRGRAAAGFAAGLAVAWTLLGGSGGGMARAASPEEQAKARDLVARTVKAFEATEREDAPGAVAFLQDASWIVRRFVSIRLRALGLPDEAYEKLEEFGRPGSGQPPATATAACQKWAAGFKGSGAGAPPPTTTLDALTVITSMVEEEIRRHARQPGVARDMVGALVGILPGCGTPEERDWVARRTLARLDKATVLAELKLPQWPAEPKQAAEACNALADWYQANRDYLYAHPGEGRVYLDDQARAHKIPSDVFRKVNQPWGADEGPNRAPARDETIR
ncbi:MAG: hypothetical protein HYZ53_03390 [Planctomycetes bacterium]|nr:hypothetical protein [Planctomycetota bacterium]